MLDWEDALPEEQLQAAEDHANTADLILCLGTSLQIRPICNLPLNTKRHGGKFVIVNLQKTPKNKAADVVIHARCDEVMQTVMQHMGRKIPCYDRWDHFQIRFWIAKAKVTGKRARQEPVSVCTSRVTPSSFKSDPAMYASQNTHMLSGKVRCNGDVDHSCVSAAGDVQFTQFL